MGGGFAAERERGELLMADYLTTDTELTSIANAIRTKGGTNAQLEFPSEFVSAIGAITAIGDVTQRSSSDLTASGATVTAPAGYYPSSASKSVTSGTAGTPTAAKGSVSNHAISVTPSVTNTTGYITGGTKSGTAVSVAASELVSGSLSITENDTYDVTNYASVVVSVSGGGSGPYVVGNNTWSVNFTINPVIADENDTVTVKCTSSMPLSPGEVLGITDVDGNTVTILKDSGMISKNETWTFTMPGYSVVLDWIAAM